MNNTIKVGFPLEADMPISTMVHHKDIVCTLHKHTLDLMFSLPLIQKHLLPAILDWDMKIPITVFIDQDAKEWIKESDVMRHHPEFYGPDSYEFAYLLDDIEDTKMKLFGMISRFRKTATQQFSGLTPTYLDEGTIQSFIQLKFDEICFNTRDLSMFVKIANSHSIVCETIKPIKPGCPDFLNFLLDCNYGKAISDCVKLNGDNHCLMGDSLLIRDNVGLSKPELLSKLFDFVYVIDGGDSVKIGTSRNPTKRLADFQSSSKFKLVSFFLCRKEDKVEVYCLRKFKQYKKNGEFFDISCMEDVIQCLRSLSLIEIKGQEIHKCKRLIGPNPFKNTSLLDEFMPKNRRS